MHFLPIFPILDFDSDVYNNKLLPVKVLPDVSLDKLMHELVGKSEGILISSLATLELFEFLNTFISPRHHFSDFMS